MKCIDLLWIVRSHRVSAWCQPSCRPVCWDAFAQRYTLQPAKPSCMQLPCPECEQLAAANKFLGGLAASRIDAPDHRRLEPTRQTKAEGKTKGGGTEVLATPVCTWGMSGTSLRLRRAVESVQPAPASACQRASYARPRPGLPRTQS